MKGKPGHASGSRQMTSRSPVTHTQKIPFIGTVWPERKKKSIKKEIKKEGQSVVVRLKDTQLHQPSSLWASHKASLCLKVGASEQEMSTRLALSQGRAHKGVVSLGLYPPVRTFYSMSSFSTPGNWGIPREFLLNIHSFNPWWARLISAAQHLSEQRLLLFQIDTEAAERTVCHNSAMSNEPTQLPSTACDPWNFPEEEKAFPCSPAWLDCSSRYSWPTCSSVTLLHGTNPCWNGTFRPQLLLLTSVIISKRKWFLSLQFSTLPACFWATPTPSDVNNVAPGRTCCSIPWGWTADKFVTGRAKKIAYFIM